ncbi:transposase [Bacillus shivajii]|uniref:REP-associated tyrosine transposase n=1 Tax=Bacillus shivajii TaxID=1983719 RepID=UPI001CFAC8D3|nr:transposase [Bacillus shivajii]UCZ52931.1 transposase [Bacillus shivajii]
MSRKLRVWYPGATYHITARGNRRTDLFEGREDYETYLAILEDVQRMYPFKLHAYCLMTNHIHLQIETINHHIKDIMKELHSRYAVWFNREHNYTGHLFQGRYGAKLIETDEYFLETSRYIHQNPQKAKMVTKPEEYEWSSYRAYISSQENPLVTISRTLSYFQPPQKLNYQQFVEGKESNILEEFKHVVQSE